MRLAAPAVLVLAAVLLLAMVLAAAATARAGDRGLYLAFVDARGWATEDPRRDALERQLFECGDEALEACRASHQPGGAHDTDRRPVYAVPSSAVDLALVERARTSAAGRTAMLDAMNEHGIALDGVVLVREGDRGALVLVLINLNTRAVARLPLRSDGTLAEGHRARAQAFLARGWVP